MEPMKLYFDVRDIFRAPRLALSGKKIWIFIIANLLGYAVYFILNYLGFSLSGSSFTNTWQTYGLYPCLFASGAPGYVMALFWIATLFWFYAISMACTAVARVTYKQLKGDDFYSSGDAWKYVKKHWHPVIFSSISLFLILVFFVAMATIFALFGKIPFVGEYLFVLPYLLYFFGAVFTLYTGVVFLISFIYTPAIVATIEEDTMGAVFNNYAVTWGQPWRIVLYHAVLLPLLYLAVAVFKLFWLGGIKLINVVFGHPWLMGEKLSDIVGTAARTVWPENLVHSIVQACTSHASSCCGGCHCLANCDWYGWLIPASSGPLSGSQTGAAFILGIFLFILMVTIFSYALSLLSVGETLMFTIFHKISDDDNILERKDEEELEEEEEKEEIEFDDQEDSEEASESDEDSGTEEENDA